MSFTPAEYDKRLLKVIAKNKVHNAVSGYVMGASSYKAILLLLYNKVTYIWLDTCTQEPHGLLVHLYISAQHSAY